MLAVAAFALLCSRQQGHYWYREAVHLADSRRAMRAKLESHVAAIGTIRGLVAEPVNDKDAALRDIAIAADAVWYEKLETPEFHWRNDDANRFQSA